MEYVLPAILSWMKKKLKSISFLYSICVCIVFVVILHNLRFIHVSGTSMLPTLQDDTYGIGKTVESINYNDIVIVRTNTYGDIIKRVIGKEGDHVVMDKSGTYVNGTEAELQFENPDIEIDVIVPDGQVFIAGDNRYNSVDSRYFGTISTKSIDCILVTKTVNKTTYVILEVFIYSFMFVLIELDSIIKWVVIKRRKLNNG